MTRRLVVVLRPTEPSFERIELIGSGFAPVLKLSHNYARGNSYTLCEIANLVPLDIKTLQLILKLGRYQGPCGEFIGFLFLDA